MSDNDFASIAELMATDAEQTAARVAWDAPDDMFAGLSSFARWEWHAKQRARRRVRMARKRRRGYA